MSRAIRQLGMFAIGGAIGFVVDAGILQLLVVGLAWDRYTGRLISFLFAATATWIFNRHLHFPRPAPAFAVRRMDALRGRDERRLRLQLRGVFGACILLQYRPPRAHPGGGGGFHRRHGRQFRRLALLGLPAPPAAAFQSLRERPGINLSQPWQVAGFEAFFGSLYVARCARIAVLRKPFTDARSLRAFPLVYTRKFAGWLSWPKKSFASISKTRCGRVYLDYAMSVIVGRALPDVRDGLKPVHRRVLYAMHELDNDWNRPYKKSRAHRRRRDRQIPPARRLVGLRHDRAHGAGLLAALHAGRRPGQLRLGRRRQRRRRCATPKCRLARIAHELLADIDKETVDFVPNYDEKEHEPTVLPTRVPNLLVNGSAGIAVGMATNIPPHNLTEVVDACLALLDDPKLDDRRADAASCRARISRPPASSTASPGIVEALRTGRGRVVDARAARTSRTRRQRPRGDHRHRAAVPGEQGAADRAHRRAGASEKKLEGISRGLRDESDKDGMRVVIELKRGEVAEVVLNNLYKQTQLQDDVRHQHGGAGRRPAAAAEPARRCSRRSSATAARWSRGARSSTCARRASARTCSKAWRSRWPTSTR